MPRSATTAKNPMRTAIPRVCSGARMTLPDAGVGWRVGSGTGTLRARREPHIGVAQRAIGRVSNILEAARIIVALGLAITGQGREISGGVHAATTGRATARRRSSCRGAGRAGPDRVRAATGRNSDSDRHRSAVVPRVSDRGHQLRDPLRPEHASRGARHLTDGDPRFGRRPVSPKRGVRRVGLPEPRRALHDRDHDGSRARQHGAVQRPLPPDGLPAVDGATGALRAHAVLHDGTAGADGGCLHRDLRPQRRTPLVGRAPGHVLLDPAARREHRHHARRRCRRVQARRHRGAEREDGRWSRRSP